MGRRIKYQIAVGLSLAITIGLIAWWLMPRSNKVGIAFSHFERQNGMPCDIAVFEVSNKGKSPVTMCGYGFGAPFYLILSDKGTNWDYDFSPNHDESKNHSFILVPGAKMSMRTAVPGVRRWMVGVEYSSSKLIVQLHSWLSRRNSEKDFIRRQMHIVWSDPITRTTQPSNIARLTVETNLIIRYITNGDTILPWYRDEK